MELGLSSPPPSAGRATTYPACLNNIVDGRCKMQDGKLKKLALSQTEWVIFVPSPLAGPACQSEAAGREGEKLEKLLSKELEVRKSQKRDNRHTGTQAQS